MTAETRKEPFAEAVEHIDSLLHPKGPPRELQPIPVDSIEQTVQRLADELQEPALEFPLVDLLHDFQDNHPAVAGVGLVVLTGRHLSIRVLTDLSGDDEEWESSQTAIEERYDKFAESLYGILPEDRATNWSLSYYNTSGRDVAALVPEILEEISKEVDASTVAFVMFERPAPAPQV